MNLSPTAAEIVSLPKTHRILVLPVVLAAAKASGRAEAAMDRDPPRPPCRQHSAAKYPRRLLRRRPPGQPASAGFQFRRIVPLLYRMTGDVAGWERARTALTGACARARQTGAETVGTSFTIDVLQTGKGRIVADQSYEQAGRAGVSYRLALVDDSGRISGSSQSSLRRQTIKSGGSLGGTDPSALWITSRSDGTTHSRFCRAHRSMPMCYGARLSTWTIPVMQRIGHWTKFGQCPV